MSTAKVQSESLKHPREVLRRMIDEGPKAAKPILVADFTARIKRDKEMVNATIEAWFNANNYSL